MSREKQNTPTEKQFTVCEKIQIGEMAAMIYAGRKFQLSSVEIAANLCEVGFRKQSEWISVEERLPDCEWGAESKAVLFITKQGFMYTGYYGCGGIFHDRYFREFKNATEGYDISNVTHWMPLPEAPKMKGVYHVFNEGGLESKALEGGAE